MRVLIPAGGRGIRLRPLTNSTPKPLLPLGDRPILTRIVEAVPAETPVDLLVTPDLRGDFERWRQGRPGGRGVGLFVERERPPGSGGPIAAIADYVRDTCCAEDLVLMMGDSILPFTLSEFLAGAGDGLRLAAYQLPDIREAGRFGVLEIAADETAASFEEKPAAPRSPWVFTGCLRIPARLLPTLEEAAAVTLPQVGRLVSHYMEKGERVEVYRAGGEWRDIGTVASYLEAHEALLPASQRLSLLSLGNRLEGVVYAHPSARVTASKLTNCLVFAGAEVANAELTNCVVASHVSVIARTLRDVLISAETETALYEGVGS